MSDSLLQWFEARRGEFVSGQEISGQLGISRTAVWKQIEKLREQGYAFEAVPRKGYRLIDKPDRINPAKLAGMLETTRMGRKLHYFKELDSTQTKAHELVSKGTGEGALVIAESQTSGRGRMGRSWHSPAGKGIWMTLALKPGIPIHFTPQLTLLTAVALCRVIRELYSLNVGIKWPNDLLIRGKKISGILLESNADDERTHYVIAGVGISANLLPEDYPPELLAKATSLAIETGRTIDREQLVARFLLVFEQLYDLYLEQGFAPIRLLWEANSVSLQKPIVVQTGKGPVNGTAVSIDEMGALCVKLDEGDTVKLYSGDVELR